VSLSKGDADFLRDHQGLFSYKGVTNPDKKEMIYAITLFGQTQLSIVDCILCARATLNRLELFTFDDELKKFCSNTPHKK
jgi:hypothetical protein